MMGRIGFVIRKFRNWFSRSYWTVRLFHLSKSEGTASAPGLVLIQIDGLSFSHYKRGLREGNLPFLSSLAKKQKYKDYEHYSGMPSNTPAMQGELFYGIKGCVPAFSFVDQGSKETFVMFDPKCAHEIETRLSKESTESLLKGGSSYSNIFMGGAEESHYCAAGGGWSRLFKVFNPLMWSLIFIFHLNIFLRTLFLIILEVIIGVYDFLRGMFTRKKIVFEFQLILIRALICVLLRELVAIGAKIDIARGLPIIHLNFVGYDEQSHWRGPTSKFAHWSLKGIDDAIAQVWKEARRAQRRDYDIWIYSDHGQADAIPYAVENGRSIEKAIEKIFGEIADTEALLRQTAVDGSVLRRRLRPAQEGFVQGEGEGKLPTPSKGKVRFSHDQQVSHASPKVVAVGMGPIVHIYPSLELHLEEKERVISELLLTAKVPVVLIPKEPGQVEARTETGKFMLPKEAIEIFGKDHPFLEEVAADLVALCHHPSAGEIIISGWYQGKKLITFASEHGSHAGYSPEETRGFALLPPDAPLSLKGHTYVRPLNLREAALRHLQRISKAESEPRGSVVKTIRILTYNVHGCLGLDGKTSPDRIARVIARQDVDIVALQEIDVGRNRSGNVDQAEKIAEKLGMTFHFHPALSLAEGKYGNAILSRYPIKIIRMEELPRLKARTYFEPRGALWVEIDVGGIKVNVITSHLSLWPAERLLQTEVLLGPNWTGNAACQAPVVLCGDFNATPRSIVCKRMGSKLRDAQLMAKDHKPMNTWLASHPMSRIDHFFVSPDIEVTNIAVPRTELDQVASDHLPLVVNLKINSIDTKNQ